MSSHTTSPSAPAASNVPQRTEQGKFTKEEKAFLDGFLPAYVEYCNALDATGLGPRNCRGNKGERKEWVQTKVIPKFIEQFQSDRPGGPTRKSLEEKIYNWFKNNKATHGSGPTSLSTTIKAVIKRPRAKNAMRIFEEEHKKEINEQMAPPTVDDGKTSGLVRYHSSKKQLFEGLDASQRDAYDLKATQHNDGIKVGPDRAEIFENQGNLPQVSTAALQSLVGWNWKQHGDVVFFLQGAYRDVGGKLISFASSIGPTSLPLTQFADHLVDYKLPSGLRQQFREWATEMLPGPPVQPALPAVSKSEETPVSLEMHTDGSPKLPNLDVGNLESNQGRVVLRQYIQASWDYMRTQVPGTGKDVPWMSLRDPSKLKDLLVDSTPFSGLKSLDPDSMPALDVYTTLATILNLQSQALAALLFAIPNHSDGSHTSIVELPDPCTINVSGATDPDDSKVDIQPINGPSAEVFNRMVDETIQREGGKFQTSTPTTNLVPTPTDIENQLKLVDSHAPITPAIVESAIHKVADAGFIRISTPATPILGEATKVNASVTPGVQPQPVTPVVVEAAIKKVAEAGFLHLSPSMPPSPLDQGSPAPAPATTTSSSKSVKRNTAKNSARKRKHSDKKAVSTATPAASAGTSTQADDGEAPALRTKRARQVAPVAPILPSRESARLHSTKYTNDYVTVRKRG